MTKFYDCFGNRLDAGTSQSKADYKIPFGKLVKGTISNSSVMETDSSNMVIMADTMVMPYKQAILTFDLPDGYVARVYYGTPYGRTGSTSNASSVQSEDIEDGETFAFPYDEATDYDKEYYYRIAFVKNGIVLADVEELISSGEIGVSCDKAEEDVIDMNIDEIKEVESRRWHYDLATPSSPVITKLPVILHVSDLHSDAIRWQRAIKVAEYLGSVLVNTGDNVAQCAKDGFQWPYELVKDTGLLPIVAQGNHDAVFMKQADFEAAFYTDWYNKYGYSQLKAYYYKDDTANGIRYICLNSCDYEGTDSASTYRINKISPAQQLWYANALLDTPAGYKVIVCLHQPLSIIDAVQGYQDFMSDRAILSTETVSNGGSGIVNITDAFIDGTTITVNGSPIDFSEKNEGVEFVMYLNGHTHADHIGYVHSASNIQLSCNVSTGCIMEGSGFTYDYQTHGLGIGKVQDLFNAYVVDGVNGKVTVIRFGSDTTLDGKKRDMMEIPYR